VKQVIRLKFQLESFPVVHIKEVKKHTFHLQVSLLFFELELQNIRTKEAEGIYLV